MGALALKHDNPAIALLPDVRELQIIKNIAIDAYQSGLLPNGIKSEKAAFVIALKGRELGVPMFTAFSEIAIINGKPTMSAMLMLAQIRRLFPRAYVHFEEVSNERCVIIASREKGEPTTRFEFSTEDAKLAGLLGKENWNKYPRAMRRSRCVSEMARTIFPDALMGVAYTPEEIDPDLAVNEDGEIVGEVSKSNAQETGKDETKQLPKPESTIEVAIEPQKTPEPVKVQAEERSTSVGAKLLDDITAPYNLGPKIKKGQSIPDTPRADLVECLNYWKGKETKGLLKTYLGHVEEYLNAVPQSDSPPDYLNDPPPRLRIFRSIEVKANWFLRLHFV